VDLTGACGTRDRRGQGGDTGAFPSEFSADGWSDDNGRRFLGHDEMRAWSGRELIGWKINDYRERLERR